ncbi:hypothetical protein MNBD_GAMMA01-142 [hydrothermal vent metagenome]|uniref:Methyltransferase domain-containing protein n=1 Tax=hydrothermal vent metagenome TaxID=652676 RepID=A0A3B0W1Z1_9ZZZZ
MSWYEDDELWEQFYACMFDDASFELAQAQVPMLLSLVNHPVNSVLDLGCGPGRHCLALAKMEFEVTGIDSSKYLLAKAINKAESSQLNPQFILTDMLDFQPEKKFDLIINMFNSFGYFDAQEKNQLLINQTFNNLGSTGTFIIDTVGKEILARNIEPVHLTEYSNGDLRIERPALINNMQIFSNEWILVSGNTVFRRNYQHYIYTAMELSEMCYQAGFDNVDVYGSLVGDEYTLESEGLVVVAQKTINP